MVSVKVAETSVLGRLETAGGLITKKQSVPVSLTWALMRYSDPNLSFEFTEDDREDMQQLPEKVLMASSKTLGETITTHSQLEKMLLPPLKKKLISKPKAKSKSSLTE